MQDKKATKKMTKQEEKTMKKAVIYIHHVEGYPGPSIEEQREACRSYATEHGYAISTEYIDSTNDSSLVCHRDIFQKMVKDSRKKQFYSVLIHSIGIVSQYEQEYMMNQINFYIKGMNLISVSEPDYTPPETYAIAILLRNYEEYCRAEHSERVKRGIRLAKERKAALAAAEKQAGI